MKTCYSCPALCCKYVALQIDTPTCKKDWSNLLWYLHHENIKIFVDQEDDWMIEFSTLCKNLGEDDKCQIYEKRPKVCRRLTTKECEFHNEESPYKLVFKNADQLIQYLDKKKINYQFNK